MTELDRKNRGAWIAQKIKDQGFTKLEVADFLGINYTTLHRWFKVINLDFPKMKQIADHIKIDLRNYYPEASYLYPDADIESKKVNEDYKEKYIDLLQKHMLLQEEFAEYKKKKG